MASHPDWEETFIPGTKVLANKLSITDPDELRQREYNKTARVQRDIEVGAISVARTYDLPHLQDLHSHLFGSLYEWAGKLRTYPMFSKDRFVEFARPDQIAAYVDAAHARVARTNWGELDHHEFAAGTASVYSYLNTGHPFREGNGRVAKLFVTQLANEHGWDLDFDNVDAHVWNNASKFTAPDLNTFEPVPDSLVPVFGHILIAADRDVVAEDDAQPVAEQALAAEPVEESAASRAARLAARGTSRQSPTRTPPPTAGRTRVQPEHRQAYRSATREDPGSLER